MKKDFNSLFKVQFCLIVLSFRALLFSTLLIIWAERQGKWSCCKCLHFFDVTNHNQNGFTFSERDLGKLSFSPKHKCFCCLSIFIFFANYHWTKVSPPIFANCKLFLKLKGGRGEFKKYFGLKDQSQTWEMQSSIPTGLLITAFFGRYIRTFSRTWHEYTQNLKLFFAIQFRRNNRS